MTILTLHTQAVHLAKDLLRTEGALLTVLMEMNRKSAFLELGYTGIFNYCLRALKLSESQASYFASVARKSVEVPELKKAIDTGVLTLSQARRIVPVITKDTQSAWIVKAAELKQRELEKEVAAVNPRAISERVKPISKDRYAIRLSISEEIRKKLERAKDLMKEGSLEGVLEKLLFDYLERKDPIKKAERAFLRKVDPKVQHQVNLRDQGRCQVPGCENRRYLEVHHKLPRAKGGPDTTQNLITLCSAHHRMWHWKGTYYPSTANSVSTP